MQTTFLKNMLLVGSGIAIAASASIFASQAGTSIQANLVNLVQYLGELHITSDGTPNTDHILSISSNSLYNFSLTGTISTLFQSGNDVYSFGVHPNIYGPLPGGGTMLSDSNNIVFAGVVNDDQNRKTATIGGFNVGSGIQVASVVRVDELQSVYNNYMLNSVHYTMLDDRGFGMYTGMIGGVVNEVFHIGLDGRLSLLNYDLPIDAGTPGQVLTTNGSGSTLYWTDVGGGTEGIITQKISLTAQDILSLDTDYIELLPAPGAGKFIRLIDASIKYNFGTAPYQDNTYSWFYMCMTYPSVTVTAYYDCVAASNILILPNSSLRGVSLNDNTEMIENEPLQITIADPDIGDMIDVDLISGDGTVDIYISYKIIDL